jgi:hypothetical protein
MSVIDEDGVFIPDDSRTDIAYLGDPEGVEVNGETFDLENVRVFRTYAHRRDEYPATIRADWKTVQWVEAGGEISTTVPTCFINSAPVNIDRRQPAAVTWGDLIERALIDMAEKAGRWY